VIMSSFYSFDDRTSHQPAIKQLNKAASPYFLVIPRRRRLIEMKLLGIIVLLVLSGTYELLREEC
jgi:hypothetical protein